MMDAKQQWDRLNRAVNVKHYIGATAHKCIDDALTPNQSEAKQSEAKQSEAKQSEAKPKPVVSKKD